MLHEGWIALVVTVLFALGIWIGWMAATDSIVKDCRLMGRFSYGAHTAFACGEARAQ